MKKAFSFMEVIISTILLSVVMISLLEIKSNSIFLLNKSQEKKELKDYISLALDSSEISNKNETIFLDRLYTIDDDTIRRELKRVKVKIKDKTLKNTQSYDEAQIGVSTFIRTYSIDDKIKTNFYAFKLEL